MIEKPRIHPLQHYDLRQMQAENIELRGHHYTVANIAAQVADMTDTVVTEAVIHAAADAGITDLYLIDKTFIREAIQEKLDRENPRPLTLEELRQHEGEPVFLVIENIAVKTWVIVDFVGGERTTFRGGLRLKNEVYGMAWIAYRHKPKEDPHG